MSERAKGIVVVVAAILMGIWLAYFAHAIAHAAETPKAQAPQPAASSFPDDAQIDAVGFSPSASCEGIVVALIGRAKSQILGQAYGFTSPNVSAALDAAEKRHVDVEEILDRSNLTAKHSRRLDIEHHHIKTWIDSAHPIAHNKVFIVDGRYVETGSYNYTAQGLKNGENCIVIDSKALADQYVAEWNWHQSHSKAQR